MHISYTAHLPANSGTSSSNLIEYLDKENQIDFNNDEIKGHESFFNSEYDSQNPQLEMNTSDVIEALDTNRGSQKLSSSNFYMINVSPSYDEIEQMEKNAIQELEERGLSSTSDGNQKVVFDDQKDELIKMQLKLYTKDLMKEYAISMNRDLYVDEEKVPNENEKKQLQVETDKIFNDYLQELGIEIETKKEEIKSNKWVELNSISIIDTKEKVSLVEITLENQNKAEVFLPTKLLQENNGQIKIPENLFKEKEQEINDKNQTVSLEEYSSSKSVVNLNGVEEVVLKFEKADKNFKEGISFSIKESDLQSKNGTYETSVHLYNQKYKNALKSSIERNFGKEKDKIFSELATSKGFDLSKRPLTEQDLLWFGKVEKSRSYKHTDKSVAHNKEIISRIKELEKNKNLNKDEIQSLRENLLKDKFTNEVIVEGNSKGGNQHHVHVVVSRHDKTMKNPRNKISLSPLANAKDAKMQNGARVGFNRKEFAEKAEMLFDQKFEYDRPVGKSFNDYNRKNQKDTTIGIDKGKAEVKQFLMKHTGLNSIKANISPVQTIKQELGIANIPTKLPKSLTDLAYKVAKKILTKGFEY